MNRIKLFANSHKGKNVLGNLRSRFPTWEGWWEVEVRRSSLMPGKMLVVPVMPSGVRLEDYMRWVAADGGDFDIEHDAQEAAQEPAGEVGNAEGSGTQA